MRQSAAVATYERAYVVCFELWRAWHEVHWSESHRARKRYNTAHAVVCHARARCDHARLARPHCARMTCGKWLAWIPGLVDGIVFDDRASALAWMDRDHPFSYGAVSWLA